MGVMLPLKGNFRTQLETLRLEFNYKYPSVNARRQQTFSDFLIKPESDLVIRMHSKETRSLEIRLNVFMAYFRVLC